MWSAVLFFCFFVFSRFWPSGANHAKTSKNKKTADPIGALVSLCGHVVCSFGFFVFSFFEVLAIWSKPCKNLEKQKTKLQTPFGLLSDCGHVVCSFVFFGFSRFWPLGLLKSDSVDMWSAVMFFCFFLPFRGSGHLEQTMQKHRKTKKLQTPLGLLSHSVDMWSAVLVFLFSVFSRFWPSGANHAKTSKNKKQNCRPH